MSELLTFVTLFESKIKSPLRFLFTINLHFCKSSRELTVVFFLSTIYPKVEIFDRIFIHSLFHFGNLNSKSSDTKERKKKILSSVNYMEEHITFGSSPFYVKHFCFCLFIFSFFLLFFSLSFFLMLNSYQTSP